MMNGIAARLDFENGLRVFQHAFRNTNIDVLDQFKLTQSDLRLEQALQANNNTYTFPVMVNIQNGGQSQFNTELRLNMQDTFLPQYIGLFLAKPASAIDTTFPLLTYPNPAVFTNATQMEAIYNGKLNIQVNNTNYITNWMTARHKLVPQTQQTAAPGAGSPLDQIDGADYGFFPMQPYVIISGSSNMQITVNLPVAPTAVDANSRLVLIFRGIIAYNSTVTT